MERDEQRRMAEALILAAPEPIAAMRIARLIPDCTAALARSFVSELNAAYAEQGRAFEIGEVAGGYRLRTLPEFAAALQKLQTTRPLRLSPAALETLAIVAYRQPATRAEVEHVRGVDAGPVLRSLLERGLIRLAGHKDTPGRPMLYGTNRRFLEVFGLARIEDLPSLRELEELVPEGAEAGAAPDGGEAGAGAEDAPQEASVPRSEEAGVDADALAAFEDAEPSGEPH